MATPDPYEEALEQQRQRMLEQLDRIEKLALSAIAERDQLQAAKLEAEEDRDRARASMNLLYDRMVAAFKDKVLLGEDFIDGMLRVYYETCFDRDRYKEDYLNACKTIAEMHEAATGRQGEAPIKGVVEDVTDLKTRHDHLLRRWQSLPLSVTQQRHF